MRDFWSLFVLTCIVAHCAESARDARYDAHCEGSAGIGFPCSVALFSHYNFRNSGELNYNSENYYSGWLKTCFGKTHKIVFICLENEILYNLRNTGSHRGRMPYNFGIDTINEFKIKRKIKNYVQQHI